MNRIYKPKDLRKRGSSSVGRAPESHSGGRQFKSGLLHSSDFPQAQLNRGYHLISAVAPVGGKSS